MDATDSRMTKSWTCWSLESVTTVDGETIAFDELWERRREVEITTGVSVYLPTLDDLIATKRFATRPKDLEDIRLLEILRSEEDS